jgi:UDP-N-acetyl-D-mannosaminuronate dehydrogenase
MPEHVVELATDAFKECNKTIQGSDILILGISYKPDVKDIQLTPAENIIKKLKDLGANIHIYDPYFSLTNVFGINTEENLETTTLKKMDAAIIVTGHKEFKNFTISNFRLMRNPILIDTRGVFDPVEAKNAKLIFRGLGRGQS